MMDALDALDALDAGTEADMGFGMGFYVHIPFCESKCGYCDFLSFDDQESLWGDYKDALIREISQFRLSQKGTKNETKNETKKETEIEGQIDSVYIGGGTPTVWPAVFLRELLDALPKGVETTCEANPGTLSEEKISALAAGGVNRISLGLQAWQPHLLKAIGRRIGRRLGHDIGSHDIRNVFPQNIKLLRDAGFDNISIDIMFALPGQSLADWEETLRQVVALEPEHISAYALTPDVIDQETDRLMYHKCREFLHEHGYMQYEISNFAKTKTGFENYQSRHNRRYWTLQPYIGFGLGAHSFDGRARFRNTTDMQKYLEGGYDGGIPRIQRDYSPLSESDAMAEFMILGLRMTEGVSYGDFLTKFNKNLDDVYGEWISKMKADGLLKENIKEHTEEHTNENIKEHISNENISNENKSRISLTDIGMDLANQVMIGFLPDFLYE